MALWNFVPTEYFISVIECHIIINRLPNWNTVTLLKIIKCECFWMWIRWYINILIKSASRLYQFMTRPIAFVLIYNKLSYITVRLSSHDFDGFFVYWQIAEIISRMTWMSQLFSLSFPHSHARHTISQIRKYVEVRKFQISRSITSNVFIYRRKKLSERRSGQARAFNRRAHKQAHLVPDINSQH